MILELLLPASVAKERVRERILAGGHGPSADIFDRMVSEFEWASSEEFHVLQLDASVDLRALVDAAVRLLGKEETFVWN